MNKTRLSIGRKGLERIDLLMLIIESLEINGVYAMLNTSKQLGIDKYFPNLVELWKCRSHNPLRKSSRRGSLSNEEVDALIILLSASSRRLYPLLRQLLSNREPIQQINNRWNILNIRFTELVTERMNLRRRAVQNLINDDQKYTLIKNLVLTLALSAGPMGEERLRQNLYAIN